MFYYVQMPKVGMVMHESNWKPYKDFQVTDKWLIPFLQAKKISLKDASQDFFLPPSGFSEAPFRAKNGPQNIQNKVLLVYSLSASKNSIFRQRFRTFDLFWAPPESEFQKTPAWISTAPVRVLRTFLKII